MGDYTGNHNLPSLFHFVVPGIPSELFPIHRWSLHYNSPSRIDNITDSGSMLLQDSGKMLLQTSGEMLLQSEE